jgi:hypothetical protein
MRSRLLAVLAAAFAVSGCASLNSAFTDSPSEAATAIPKSTPDQAYNAGVVFLEHGDDDAARREWSRCVAMSAPDSATRAGCLIALEKLAAPGSIEQ